MRTFTFFILFFAITFSAFGKSVNFDAEFYTTKVRDSVVPSLKDANEEARATSKRLLEREKKLKKIVDSLLRAKFKVELQEKKPYITRQMKRVYKVYPYAVIAADKMRVIEMALDSLRTKKEKEQYLQQMQQHIELQFTEQIKNLTPAEGRILLKLIHRQTGNTAYQIIEKFRSHWYAFSVEKVVTMFDISLLAEYNPEQNEEDFWLELIVQTMVGKGRLASQEPFVKYNLWKLYKQRARRN